MLVLDWLGFLTSAHWKHIKEQPSTFGVSIFVPAHSVQLPRYTQPGISKAFKALDSSHYSEDIPHTSELPKNGTDNPELVVPNQ